MAIKLTRQKKKGSYHCRHRSVPSRWFQNWLQQKTDGVKLKAVFKQAKYDTVKDCMNNESPHAKH